MIRFKDFIKVCDDGLTVVIWNMDDKYLGEFHPADVSEKWNGLYADWIVSRIIGSGKGNLIDVVITEEV